MPRFVYTDELADELGMRREAVQALARQKQIPAIKLGNGRYAFNLDAVVEALRTGRCKALELEGATA